MGTAEVLGGELQEVVVELVLVAKQPCIFGEKAEDESHTELVDRGECIGVVGVCVLRTYGIVNLSHKVARLNRQLHLLLECLAARIHEETKTERDCQPHVLAVSSDAVDVAQPKYYSALTSSAGAASDLGAVFLPARRVVFLAAGLAAALSIFSL